MHSIAGIDAQNGGEQMERRIRADRGGDSLVEYLHDIQATPLLSAQEEQDLAVRVRQGDESARHQFISANLRLVVKISRGYMGRGMSLPDLIEEGNLGLIRAVSGFKPEFGTRFSTYGSYWINQSIKRAIDNTSPNGCPMRFPVYIVRLIGKWHRAVKTLSNTLHREPTDQEIKMALGLSDKQWQLLQHGLFLRQRSVRRDDLEDDNHYSLDQNLIDERSLPDEEVMEEEEIESALGLLETLSEREATVIKLHFGVGGMASHPMTLEEIGKRLGVSREGARKIQRRALNKLGHKG